MLIEFVYTPSEFKTKTANALLHVMAGDYPVRITRTAINKTIKKNGCKFVTGFYSGSQPDFIFIKKLTCHTL